MNEATADDLSRDLAADLATCDAATGGPWIYPVPLCKTIESVGALRKGIYRAVAKSLLSYKSSDQCEADARMIAASREGWPVAIRRALAAEAIINAPVVALFADGREPTTNERHLLNLLSWREREAAEAATEVKRLQAIIEGLSDRVAVQSELLSARAEKP